METSRRVGEVVINRVRKMAGDQSKSKNKKESNGHDPAPFKERYRKALADSRLSRNLLNFQRNWRPSRDMMFAEFKVMGDDGEKFGPTPQPKETAAGNFPQEATPTPGENERDFQTMRHKLAMIKDAVIDNQDFYLELFKRNARANGIIIHEVDTPKGYCQVKFVEQTISEVNLIKTF